jgi:hypothetical protein
MPGPLDILQAARDLLESDTEQPIKEQAIIKI